MVIQLLVNHKLGNQNVLRIRNLIVKQMGEIINNFQKIVVENPADKIIGQIKQLISSGQLKPGERLPAERVLAEELGVGRSYVREAIRKLEFFGLLKTSPQSGTYVSGYNIRILEGLLMNVINLNTDDFAALIEVRYYLELTIARLAAQRRTIEDIQEIRCALDDYERKVKGEQSAVEEDLYFHLKIAHASANPVYESILLTLLPDIIRHTIEKQICGKGRAVRALKEHEKLVKAIEAGLPEEAEIAMAEHLEELKEVSQNTMNSRRNIQN